MKPALKLRNGAVLDGSFPETPPIMASLTLCYALVLILQRKMERSSIDDVATEFNIPLKEFDQAGQEYESFQQSIRNYKKGNT